MLGAGFVGAAAPVAGAAKGAKGAAQGAASLGSTIASAVAPIAINTMVGGIMGGERGAAAGLLGGLLSQGTQSIMGGMFNKPVKGMGASAKDMTAQSGGFNDLNRPSFDMGARPIEGIDVTSTPKLDIASEGKYSLPSARPVAPDLSFRPSSLSVLSGAKSTGNIQPIFDTAGQAGGQVAQTVAPGMGTGDILDKIFQQQRMLNEENYQRNLKSSIYGTATKGLMGGIGSYFKGKAEEEEPVPYTPDPEGAIARGRARAAQRKNRQLALKQGMYPRLGRV